MALLTPSTRLRRTPFSEGVEAAGVQSYTVYNHVLLPTSFRGLEEDYRHLKEAVQVWDVSCERQVSVKGKDALRLIQLLTPRDLSAISSDRCLYIPVVDQMGGMLNDPVLLQVGGDEYWISLADSDLLYWVLAIGAANGFDVEVTEPDISPLGIQGPKANDLAAAVFGDAVRELRFFGCARFRFQNEDLLVARSGYSKQGGFEVYVPGGPVAMALWNALFEAGRAMDVHAGCPNLIERVESGLLSYGSDMTRADSPLNCGLGRYVSDNQLDHCFGGRAIREERARGSAREIRAVAIDGQCPPCDRVWPVLDRERQVGRVTSAAWSPDFATTVAIGMIDQSHWAPGTALTVMTQDGVRTARVQGGFWI